MEGQKKFEIKEDRVLLFEQINELLDCEVLDLIWKSEEKIGYLPYMMNDALESYWTFTDCVISGDFHAPFPADTSVQLLQENGRNGLLFRRPDSSVVSLWFQKFFLQHAHYQYHAIGHFWIKGQEQWRQLVYILGTIRDKADFLGAEDCSLEEQFLLPLVGFAPLCYWTPMDVDWFDWYPETEESIKTMHQLARKVGDHRLLRWMLLYQCPLLRKKLTPVIAHELTRPEHLPLYEEIWKQSSHCSEAYPERDYGPVLQQKIQLLRQESVQKLIQKGYTGNYPFFRKGRIHLVAAEEHPFTVSELDYQDFSFQIQWMLSESDSDLRNAGFFEGNGRIVTDLEELP